MTGLNVGSTFVVDDTKYSIKLIDLDGSNPLNKTKKPRVDASPFYTTPEGEEKIRLGRPKKFAIKDVCKALKVPVPEGFVAPGFTPSTSVADMTEEEWELCRSQKQKVAELVKKTSEPYDDSDW